MRIDWDDLKSEETFNKRGFTFETVSVVLERPHAFALKSDDLEQFIAIGFVGVSLLSVVYEERVDELGDYIWIVTYWRSTREERKLYEEIQK